MQENLDCPELIDAFELARTKSSKKPEKRKLGAGGEPKAKRKDGERPRGFDRGLDPERIIGDPLSFRDLFCQIFTSTI